ncbi:MAG: hypothetical protein ACT4P7_17275 [Gemmatimonadaceae bacterium]
MSDDRSRAYELVQFIGGPEDGWRGPFVVGDEARTEVLKVLLPTPAADTKSGEPPPRSRVGLYQRVMSGEVVSVPAGTDYAGVRAAVKNAKPTKYEWRGIVPQ